MKPQVLTRRLFVATFLCLFCFSGMTAAMEHNDSDRTRQFVVMGYQGILFDVDRGGGPYLSTLADLLGISDGDRGRMAPELQRLAETYPNIMDFSDHVVALQQGAPTTTASASPEAPIIWPTARVEASLRHLTRGALVIVELRGGERVTGRFVEFQSNRVWLRGATRRSVVLKDIAAIHESAEEK